MSRKDVSAHPIVLTDDAGVELTIADYGNGWYVIEMVGAGDAEFFIDWEGNKSGEVITIKYMVDTAVTLSMTLEQELINSANYQPVPAHTSGTIAADGSSQECNSNYPLREFLYGCRTKVVLAVSGATTAACQVTYD